MTTHSRRRHNKTTAQPTHRGSWRQTTKHKRRTTMKKVFIGSAIAVTLMGAGILAGSVLGAGSVAAQTPSTTPQATSTPKAATTPGTTNPSADPREGLGDPGRGGHGYGGIDDRI